MYQKQLEIEEREFKKEEREGLTTGIQVNVFSKPSKDLEDSDEKTKEYRNKKDEVTK